MARSGKARQTIVIHEELGGFATADRPTAAHHKIMSRYASPLMGGPRRSGVLVEFVCHMYSEEEAERVQHLPVFRPRARGRGRIQPARCI